MKQVAVSELKEKATVYLTRSETLAIEHNNGEVIGFYYPKKRTKQEEVDRAVKQLSETVQRILAETGMTEDELADLFDPSKPFPYDTDS
ncbi:hypothetical protein [Argonema antarcticum]|uniref:hypothetical protein n=1 Tax=Argonema antarcticum TaxID=2942763 RepID=UPI002013558C|nr:hypothetical protein [Argonema antarcticum]MCL1475528.1 hypothetical protein [Argonema antarcticum A004/B2]